MVTDTVRQKRYPEDRVVGESAESAPLTIDLEEMLDFARSNDPQYFHTDPQAVSGSIFGGVVQMRYTLINRRDEILFSCLSVNLIETRPPSASPPDGAAPC